MCRGWASECWCWRGLGLRTEGRGEGESSVLVVGEARHQCRHEDKLGGAGVGDVQGCSAFRVLVQTSGKARRAGTA